MKNCIKKLFSAVMAFAVAATLCTTVSFADDASSEPAEMYFDNTYGAWLMVDGKKSPTNEEMGTSSFVTQYNMNSTLDNMGMAVNTSAFKGVAFFKGSSMISSSVRPGQFMFDSDDSYLTVKLLQKEGYDLKTLAFAVSLNYTFATYVQPFDYAYTTDESVTATTVWTKISNTSYTNEPVASTNTSANYVYYETVKVPDNATYIKVYKNSITSYSNNGSNNNWYPSVVGFTFGYIPEGDPDVIKIKMSSDTEVMNLLASGMVADGANEFIYSNTVYNNKLGFTDKNANTTGITLNAFDGYKITAVEANSYNGNESGRSVSIKLGSSTAVQAAASTEPEKISVASVSGEDSFTILSQNNGWTPGVLYDIVITMEKPEVVTSIDLASNSGVIVTVNATVANLDVAEYDGMEFILAGYDAEGRFTGAATKTVYKNDEDGKDTQTAYFSTSTTLVKAFLWTDLDQIKYVIPAIDQAVTSN